MSEHLAGVEQRPWAAADRPGVTNGPSPAEFSTQVLGLIFQSHADTRIGQAANTPDAKGIPHDERKLMVNQAEGVIYPCKGRDAEPRDWLPECDLLVHSRPTTASLAS